MACWAYSWAYNWALTHVHGDVLGPQASPWTCMPLRAGFREATDTELVGISITISS